MKGWLIWLIDLYFIFCQLLNSCANLVIAVFLYLLRSELGEGYFVAHVVIISIAFCILSGLWVAICVEDTRLPLCLKERAPRALLFLLALPIAPFTPMWSLFDERAKAKSDSGRTSTGKDSSFVDDTDFPTTSQALQEERKDLLLSVKLASSISAFISGTKDAHFLYYFQLGAEGIPLLIVQLVLTLSGALDDSLAEGDNTSVQMQKGILAVLIRISLSAVTGHICGRMFMVCRSVDVKVTFLRWLFCVYDLVTFVYMMAFLSTVGRPFRDAEAFAKGDFGGGCLLSLIWLGTYLGMFALTTVIVLFGALLSPADTRVRSILLTLFFLLAIGPLAAALAGLKLTVINLLIMSKESEYGVSSSAILLFGFLRRGKWTVRLLYVGRFLDAKMKVTHSDPLSKQDAATAWVRFSNTKLTETNLRKSHVGPILASFFPRFRADNLWNICRQVVHRGFASLQIFTFLFPFLAFCIYCRDHFHAENRVLLVLFFVSLGLLLLMAPFLPRFWQYLRFRIYCEEICRIDRLVAPVVERAIQEFYVPPHHKVICDIFGVGGATEGEGRSGYDSERLLPYDIVERLSSFICSTHLDFSELTRAEASRLRGDEDEGAGGGETRHDDDDTNEHSPLLR